MNAVKVTLGVEERCSHSTDMKGIERELNTEEEWGDEIGSYPPHVPHAHVYNTEVKCGNYGYNFPRGCALSEFICAPLETLSIAYFCIHFVN
jgi:hypothetical protein